MYKENKKRVTVWRFVFAAVTALVLCAVCVGGVSGADTWNGKADTSWYTSNQSATTYTITTAEQLAGLAELVNSGTQNFAGRTIILGADLDLSGHEWTSIGYIKTPLFGSKVSRPFKGIFDGAGYTISGITQTLEWGDEGGLFGYVSGGTVTGVTLTDSTFVVTGSSITLGSLVGILEDGNVNNCNVESVTITSDVDWDSLGGIIAGIFGSHTVGGAVGLNDGGVVSGYDISVEVEENLRKSWLNGNGCVFGEIVGDGGYLSAPSYYTITVNVGENGSANPSDELAYMPGDSATYSFTPDSGYAIGTIFLDDVNVTQGNVTGDGRDKTVYTLASVTSNHTIHVTFRYSPEFTITIPNSLILDNDTMTGNMRLTAEDVWLPENEQISVSVSSAYDFALVNSKDNSIQLGYDLTVGDSTQALSNGDTALNVTQAEYDALDSSVMEVFLNAKVTEIPQYSGNYSDSLTFTVQLKTT